MLHIFVILAIVALEDNIFTDRHW